MAASAASGGRGSKLGGFVVKVGFGVCFGSGFGLGRRGFGEGRGSPREDGAGGHHAATSFTPERADSAARAGLIVGRARVRVRLGSRVGGVGVIRGGRGARDALRGARPGGGAPTARPRRTRCESRSRSISESDDSHSDARARDERRFRSRSRSLALVDLEDTVRPRERASLGTGRSRSATRSRRVASRRDALARCIFPRSILPRAPVHRQSE